MKALTLKPGEPLTLKVPFRLEDKPALVEGWRPYAGIAPKDASLAAPLITRAPGAGIKPDGDKAWNVTVPANRLACLRPGEVYVIEVAATHPEHERVVAFLGKFTAPEPVEEKPAASKTLPAEQLAKA